MNILKQLSISLVLLCCFAVTSKMGACYFSEPLFMHTNAYGNMTQVQEECIPKLENEIKLEILKNIKKVSEEGLKEEDMIWIINAIENNRLNMLDLNILIESGLKKYLDYKHYEDFFIPDSEGESILNAATTAENLEFVNLLISIGAKAGTIALEEKINKLIEKEKMGQNLMAPKNKKISDTRIHFTN